MSSRRKGSKPLFDESKFPASDFHLLTPYEVAQYLRIEGATQPSDQFGDVILAASISTVRRQHIDPEDAGITKVLNLLYQAFQLQRMGAAMRLSPKPVAVWRKHLL